MTHSIGARRWGRRTLGMWLSVTDLWAAVLAAGAVLCGCCTVWYCPSRLTSRARTSRLS